MVGKLESGTRLGTKADLRARFGVAAATVNEAVRMLEMRGLATARPGPGGGVFVQASTPVIRLQHVTVRVKEASEQAVVDALVVRRALETPICQDAGRQRNKTQIRKLRKQLAVIERAFGSDQYIREIWRLHREIAEITKNQILREVYLGVLDVVEDNFAGLHGGVDTHSRRDQDHRELVEAIASGDADAITTSVLRHNSLSTHEP